MYTVIVVDDEEQLRKALIRKVDWELAGFQVVGEAENGVEALELVAKYEPDLLLTDVKMPFMTGIELARAVREIRPTANIVFLSGYDDFSYAQKAIQYNIISYLLKPISAEELTQELIRIRMQIDDKFAEFQIQNSHLENVVTSEFLIPLLLDSFQEDRENRENELLGQAVTYGVLEGTSDQLKYSVMVTSFLDGEGNNQTKVEQVHAIELILKKYVRYASFYTEGRIVSLLIATRLGFEKYLHILVEEIAQSAKRILNLETAIGVSRSIGYLSHTNEAYIEAMNAIRYCKKSDQSVYFIADIERNEIFDQELVQNVIQEIENYLRGGSVEELKVYLEELMPFLQRETNSPAMIQLMMVQLVAAVFRIIYASADQETVQALHLASPIQGQFFHEDVKEMWYKYMKFCILAKELVLEARKKNSSNLCEMAIQMIEETYADPNVSLVSISNHIAVSPNYLSGLIKKYTGSTFIDLLTKKRIETAKSLLVNTDYKVKEIAEQCGYSDQHYFSYCFKKYVGCSPNACRRENEESMG
ncbi:MAG: response regulator [Eubacteriales bacterium]